MYLKPFSLLHLLDFTVHKKFLFSSISLPLCASVPLQTTTYNVADCENHCHASHAGPQLCESASSCSAICPKPGSLIREESCGKVCVSLPDVPLSLQLFVRVGPSNNTRGAGTSTQQLGCGVCIDTGRNMRKHGNIPRNTRL